jgi:hypothetical protein
VVLNTAQSTHSRSWSHIGREGKPGKALPSQWHGSVERSQDVNDEEIQVSAMKMMRCILPRVRIDNTCTWDAVSHSRRRSM